MARNKIKNKKVKSKNTYKKLKIPVVWLEDKITLARKVSKHRAARAAARYGAPAGVALLFFIFVYSLLLPKDRFQSAKERLVKNPNELEAHLILAEEYLTNNQIEEAEKELQIIDSLQASVGRELTEENNEQVLGETSPLETENWLLKTKRLWQRKRESNPEDIKELIEKWKEIVFEKPDYRDGYLQLAFLHYKLYENEKAKEYLRKALELDPNYEPAKEMEKILGD